MVDVTKTTETVATTDVVEVPVSDKAETVEELKARLALAELKAKNKTEEAERHFKKLEKFEQEEAKRKEAEMTEIERANKRAQELEAQVKDLQFKTLQQTMAAKVGLDSRLADRIRGETPEEMEADAKFILETQPKQKAAPNTGTTSPGGNAASGESVAEKRQRLFG